MKKEKAAATLNERAQRSRRQTNFRAQLTITERLGAFHSREKYRVPWERLETSSHRARQKVDKCKRCVNARMRHTSRHDRDNINN